MKRSATGTVVKFNFSYQLLKREFVLKVTDPVNEEHNGWFGRTETEFRIPFTVEKLAALKKLADSFSTTVERYLAARMLIDGKKRGLIATVDAPQIAELAFRIEASDAWEEKKAMRHV